MTGSAWFEHFWTCTSVLLIKMCLARQGDGSALQSAWALHTVAALDSFSRPSQRPTNIQPSHNTTIDVVNDNSSVAHSSFSEWGRETDYPCNIAFSVIIVRIKYNSKFYTLATVKKNT